MKSFQEFMKETEMQRAKMSAKMEEDAKKFDGKSLPIKEMPDALLEIILTASATALYSELAHYHNWLMEQLGEKQGETLDGTPISI